MISKENLMQTLGFGGMLNLKEIEQVAAAGEPRKLKAGSHFIRQHKSSTELAFIEQGIMRAYIVSGDRQESTTHFLRRNQFVMDIPGFYDGIPATTSVQAVTDTQLIVIDQATWTYLCEVVPKLFLFAKMLTELALLNKLKDNDFLRFGTARQKYSEFVERYPDLALAVPLQYIASYLQITPQSLSRLRKKP